MDFRKAQSADQIVGTLKRVKRNYGACKNPTKRSWGFSSDNGVTARFVPDTPRTAYALGRMDEIHEVGY